MWRILNILRSQSLRYFWRGKNFFLSFVTFYLQGPFIGFNEETEVALLQKFFDYILDVKPHILVNYNGDFFDWLFLETRAAIHSMDMEKEIGFGKIGKESSWVGQVRKHFYETLCMMNTTPLSRSHGCFLLGQERLVLTSWLAGVKGNAFYPH